MQVSYFSLYCVVLQFLQSGVQFFWLFQSCYFQIKNSSSTWSFQITEDLLLLVLTSSECMPSSSICNDPRTLLWSLDSSDFWSSAFSKARTRRSSLDFFEPTVILVSIWIVLSDNLPFSSRSDVTSLIVFQTSNIKYAVCHDTTRCLAIGPSWPRQQFLFSSCFLYNFVCLIDTSLPQLSCVKASHTCVCRCSVWNLAQFQPFCPVNWTL